ncbi:hypothetical protein [uncultured Tessaracoccus sp.]|uniref:hypothetical protein n=1 Tax=uncultured Tessaracoccus sp. TaxID=905023 RepID=UPI00262E1DE7|nr:hypothetical protein [uncultured Tessaracoccus sp.]
MSFPTVDLSSASPITLPEIVKLGRPPEGHPDRIVLALASNAALVSFDPSENRDSEEIVKSGRVGLLYDNQSSKLFDSTAHIRSDGLARQTYAGDIDDNWAVWMETSSTDLSQSNWRLFSQRLSGGTPRLVAAAEDQLSFGASEVPLLGGDPVPKLSAGLVWWWTATQQQDGTFGVRVLAADPAGGEPKEMLPSGYYVSPIDGGVVAVQLEHTPESHNGTNYKEVGVVRIDGSGRVTNVIRYSTTKAEEEEEGVGVSELASGGDVVAALIQDNIIIVRANGAPIARIPLPLNTEVGDLAVCSGKVAFAPTPMGSEGDKVFIFDTATSTLTAMKAPHAYSAVMCSKTRLAWGQLEEPDYITTHVSKWK